MHQLVQRNKVIFHSSWSCMCVWQVCLTSGECETNRNPTTKVKQYSWVLCLLVWISVSVWVCVHVCAVDVHGRYSLGKTKNACTCSILLRGFSSSGVKITSSLCNPYPPSWPGNINIHTLHTAPWKIISVYILSWLQCCIADCNIIMKFSSLHTRQTNTHTTTHTHAYTHTHMKAQLDSAYTSALRLFSIFSCFASSKWLISSFFPG